MADSIINLNRTWPEGSAAEAAEKYRAGRISQAGDSKYLIQLADELVTRVLNEAERQGRDANGPFGNLPGLTLSELEFLYRALDAEVMRPGATPGERLEANSLRTCVAETMFQIRRRS